MAGGPQDGRSTDASRSADAGVVDAEVDAGARTDARVDATADANACPCFSSGQWALSNLSPCIYHSSGGSTYLYAASLNPDGTLNCGGPFEANEVPPASSEPWSESTFVADCAGQFRLCFAIKAGDFDDPRSDDCQIMQTCVEARYEQAGVVQELEPLPSWNTTTMDELSCSAAFEQSGGYGEMSVSGVSDACGPVDDGMGAPLVFHRVNYCAPSCQDPANASRPDCLGCTTGDPGMF